MNISDLSSPGKRFVPGVLLLSLLSACGGGGSSGSYTIGGTISGLSTAGLVLANGNDTKSVASDATRFAFDTPASSYAVTVKSHPSGQTCVVSQGSGTASADVTSVLVSCRGYVAYVTNTGSSQLASFSVGREGALSALSGGVLSTSYPPTALALSPDGSRAFTVHQDDKNISTFTLSSTGAPTLSARTAAVSESRGLAVGSSGSALYVANYTDKTLSQFAVASSGSLSALSPATVDTQSTPYAVALSPNGQFAYVANAGSNTLTPYTVGSGGALTALSSGSVSTTAVGSNPLAMDIGPGSNTLYVVLADSAKVAQFNIGSTGALSAMSPASVATGNTPRGIRVSPNGQCAYVSNRGDGSVSAYVVTSSGLTAAASGPVSAGSLPTGLAISPDSLYLYVANTGSASLSQYAIQAGCGLTALGSVSSGGLGPTSIDVR